MRLKAGIWVKAYIRRCQSAGVPAAVVRHGDDDGGTIFIRINRLDGTSMLFGPAPAGFDEAKSDRQFTAMLGGRSAPDADVEAFLAREVDFDSDLWIVEIEARDGQHYLDGWLARSGP